MESSRSGRWARVAGDLGRQLVSRGNQKSLRCPPPGVDSNQPKSGPWSTPNHLVKAESVVFFVQLGSVESLADRRSALCWSSWVVEDTLQSGGGKRPGRKPMASEA